MCWIRPRSTSSSHPLKDVALDGVAKPVLKKGTTIGPLTPAPPLWMWEAKTGAVKPATVTSQHTSLCPGFIVTLDVPLPWPLNTAENGSPPASEPDSRSPAAPTCMSVAPTTNTSTSISFLIPRPPLALHIESHKHV